MSSRFLFILYFLPPAPGTAPRRNARMASYLARHTQKAMAFTAEYPGRPPAPIRNLEIRTQVAVDYRSILRRQTADGYLPESAKHSFWKQALIKAINTFPVNILIGEGGYFYYKVLLRKTKREIKTEGYTHLYSSFRPFADHYIAYKLKREFPHLVWIADFRDLVVDPHTGHIFFPEEHQRFLKKMFSFADVLTTVSEGLALHLRKWHKKVIVVRNGIEHLTSIMPSVPCAFFTIAYTGSMFLDQRNPEPLFEALHRLRNKNAIEATAIQIVYAGKDSAPWTMLAEKYGCREILKCVGIVSAEEAKEIQKRACINLLLTTSSDQLSGVLTGKLIEYLEAGRPVLGIVRHQPDAELNDIFRNTGAGSCFTDRPEDVPAICDFMLSEYKRWKQSGNNRMAVNQKSLQEEYSMDAVMKPLMDHLGF